MKSSEEFSRVAVENKRPRSDADELRFITQLLKYTRTMSHIDELLRWLQQQFVQHLQMQVAQCWAMYTDTQGQQVFELRAYAYKDPVLPLLIVSNEQVQLLAKRIATERKTNFFQPVEALFPLYQTILLKRHGLHYCGGCFIQQNTLLPPPESEQAANRLPVPVRLSCIFFVHHPSAQKLLPIINTFIEHALRVARERSLLPPIYEGLTVPLNPPSHPLVSLPTVSELIPHRLESQNFLRNPFSDTLAISDKKARRLYKKIDGHTSVRALAALLRVSTEELFSSLRFLLVQKRIQLYESGGKPINAETLLQQW